LTIRGIRPHYAESVTLDLSTIPGPIVAICGENGTGKSVLLGSIMAALYREWPTKAGLAEMTLGRDSLVRADVTTGEGRAVISQMARGKTGESMVTRDGVSLLATGKVTEFDAWAALHLPPAAVLYASTFGAQGSAGLLDVDLTPQDRRNILFRALRLERVEPMPQRCRDMAAEARNRGTVIDTGLAMERSRADVDSALIEHLRTTSDAELREMDLFSAKRSLNEARARHAGLVAAWNDAEAAKKARADAVAKLNAEATKRVHLLDRIERAKVAAAGAADVEAAAGQVDALAAEVAGIETSIATSRMALEAARRDAKAEEDKVFAAGRAVDAASLRLAAADKARKGLALAEESAAKLPEAEAAAAAAVKAYEDATAEVDRLRAATLCDAGLRIGCLRAGLVDITRCGDIDTARRYATDSIAVDDGTTRLAAEAFTKLDAALAAVPLARAARSAAENAVGPLQAASNRIPDLRLAAAGGDEAEAEIRTATSARSDATREAERLRGIAKTLADGLQLDEPRLADAKRRCASAKATAARGPAIAAARATLAELEPQLVAAEDAVRAAGAALDLAPEPPTVEPAPDVASQEKAVAAAEEALRRADGAVAVAEAAHRDALAAAARVAELEAQRRGIDEEIADWARLEADCRAILQLSIDAAAPEIAALTNQLLREAYGPRYTVSIETTRRSADGKKEIEDCYPHVIDSANGVDGSTECLSPGQRAIVGEAVRFAISHIVCRAAGITGPTIIRDESAGAIAEATIPEWITMLRIGARLLQSEHVLIVCHNTIAESLADARVRVAGGRITVD